DPARRVCFRPPGRAAGGAEEAAQFGVPVPVLRPGRGPERPLPPEVAGPPLFPSARSGARAMVPAMAAEFAHLHLHTLYSLLDGAIRLPDLMESCARTGMKSVAVTDHGNMFGVVNFYQEAKKHGIKPVIGFEAYIAGEKGMGDKTQRVGNH